uniref:Uncharacterized protein n=1 Tax=Stegastes partitus TaxID=144197 RepID=A0A3B5A3E5_9TELE
MFKETKSFQHQTTTSCLLPGLFGHDAGRHTRLAVLVLGFTHIVSKVDGLHVLDGHDALRHPGGVAHPSVDQPPGGLDVNWTVVLHRKQTVKLTSTSGSPSTVQVTLTLSPPLTESGEDSRLTKGGPLGTATRERQL